MSLLRKKKFRMLVFVVSGGLILYNVWFFTLGKKKPAPAKTKPAGAHAESGSGAAATDRSSWGEVHPKAAAATPEAAPTTFGRDPFLLPEEESEGKTFEAIFRERLEASRGAATTPVHEVLARLGHLKLTGILHDAERPVAVVDHRLVRRGDELLNGFFEVVDIEKEAVRLRHGGSEFLLPLPEKKNVATGGAPDAKAPRTAPPAPERE
jgi:hypothetical protein